VYNLQRRTEAAALLQVAIPVELALCGMPFPRKEGSNACFDPVLPIGNKFSAFWARFLPGRYNTLRSDQNAHRNLRSAANGHRFD
jgi:hypothetical protein